MAYQNLDRYTKVLLKLPWYRVDNLTLLLLGLRKVNFSIVEQRQQALERLNSLEVHIPFGPDRRFVDDDLYICEGLGDWPRKFQQLKLALSYKERDLRSNKEEGNVPLHFSSSQDAHVAFWNATTSIMDQLKRLDDVYDTETFEARFKLRWA